jgi:glutathione S-transferase
MIKAGIYPRSLSASILENAPNFWTWAHEVSKQPSVTGIYDEEKIIAGAKARIAKLRGN